MRKSRGLSEFLFIGCILLIVIVLVIAVLATSPAHAADNAPSVCRDTSYEGGIRYQFRDIPQSWIETGYWYVAADSSMDGNTFTADAITSYPDDASGIKVGEAVLGTSDYSVILKGTADTAPCDQPAESIPVAPQCPAWAWDTNTGALVCLYDLPYATNG